MQVRGGVPVRNRDGLFCRIEKEQKELSACELPLRSRARHARKVGLWLRELDRNDQDAVHSLTVRFEKQSKI